MYFLKMYFFKKFKIRSRTETLEQYLLKYRYLPVYSGNELLLRGYSEKEIQKILKLDLEDQFEYLGFSRKQIEEMYNNYEI